MVGFWGLRPLGSACLRFLWGSLILIRHILPFMCWLQVLLFSCCTLSIWASSLLWLLSGAGKKEVLGLVVEPLDPDIYVSSNVRVCKVHVSLEGPCEAIGVNGDVAVVRGTIRAGVINVKGDGAPINGARPRLDKIEA